MLGSACFEARISSSARFDKHTLADRVKSRSRWLNAHSISTINVGHNPSLNPVRSDRLPATDLLGPVIQTRRRVSF